jgi:hypothetical protein
LHTDIQIDVQTAKKRKKAYFRLNLNIAQTTFNPKLHNYKITPARCRCMDAPVQVNQSSTQDTWKYG